MSAKNETEVLIGGKTYTLSGYESEEYLQKVALYINGKITDFKKSDVYRRQTADVQATLLELNIADDYFKAKKLGDELESDIEKKDKEKKSYRFDDRKAPKQTEQKPKGKGGKFASEKRVKPAPKPVETFERGKRELHGDEFVSKFVTFRQPTMIDDKTTENKQFRKRKNKE